MNAFGFRPTQVPADYLHDTGATGNQTAYLNVLRERTAEVTESLFATVNFAILRAFGFKDRESISAAQASMLIDFWKNSTPEQQDKAIKQGLKEQDGG